jgi:hypothetical protein
MKTSNSPATSPTPTTCAEWEPLIEFYVDAELRGANARAQFPGVWLHLQSCAHCRNAYNLLMSSLRESAPSNLNVASPFMAPPNQDAGWQTRVRSRVGGKRLGFEFRIQPRVLQTLFQVQSAGLRGQASESDKSMLLSDVVDLGGNEVLAELWLHRTGKNDQARIQITLSSAQPLPEPIRVTVSWQRFRFSKTLKRGQGWIERVPLEALKNAPSVRVDFQAGSHGASLEEYREG